MLISLFRYKAWANAQMVHALGGIDASRFPDAWRKAVRVRNHTLVVDRIFAAHLSDRAHSYTATNTEATPELGALAAAVEASDHGYLEYVPTLAPARLQEQVSFRFVDGNPGRMSRGAILAHLIAQGACHRGQIGMVLRSLSLEPPADTVAGDLHCAQPQRARTDQHLEQMA